MIDEEYSGWDDWRKKNPRPPFPVLIEPMVKEACICGCTILRWLERTKLTCTECNTVVREA